MGSNAARRLLLVHAHPDDETITTGGTIARYASDPDTHVTLVTCTLGEQGEVMVPALAGLAAEAADQLGGYRVGELATAMAALGLRDQRFLGGIGRWRDSGMTVVDGRPAVPPTLHPRAFCAPGERAEQVDALAAIMAETRPQVVVGYDPAGGYGHPDHVRAHEITMAAAARTPSVRKVYWTVVPRADLAAGLAELTGADLPWRLAEPGELVCVPDETVTTRLDVGRQLPAKLAALRGHATQLTVWANGERRAFALTNEIGQPVYREECYVLAAGASGEAGLGRAPSLASAGDTAQNERDLFEGIETA